jgi:HK97 family phage major capsid protein
MRRSAQVVLNAHKSASVVLASEELVADALDLDAYLDGEIGARIAQLEGTAFVLGSAQLIGHADAGFTLKVYARDGRDRSDVVDDVLARASGAGIGG